MDLDFSSVLHHGIVLGRSTNFPAIGLSIILDDCT
jgi:hypothetical protein